MDLLLHIDLKKNPEQISYREKVLLIGSCFTEHIGNAMAELKFNVLQNPNGILFGPDAVCQSLLSYKNNKQYRAEDLFYLNEVWNSWHHHSRFSNTDRDAAVKNINASQARAHQFLKEADWLIITLGSSFNYELTAQADGATEATGSGVANCHRAPASWFEKKLLETEAIKEMLEDSLKQLKAFNPGLRFIFTISPVRHIRDGVVENNRSKARLIEAVHYIVSRFGGAYYFPAYELVIDVLRDYRFYDVDLVHPNYPATEFVLEKFSATFIDEMSQEMMKEMKSIVTARKHKPFQPSTNAHRQFLRANLEKARRLQEQFPFIDLGEEIRYFSENK